MIDKEYKQVVAQALEEYHRRRIDAFPDAEELETMYTPSARFERKMRRLIKRRRKAYYPLINTLWKRTAAVIIAVTVAVFGLMSVKAIREPVVNFIVEIHRTFTRIFSSRDSSDASAIAVIEEYYLPAYIPAGYEQAARKVMPFMASYEFLHPEYGIMTFEQSLFSDTRIRLDTEEDDADEILVSGNNGMFYRGKDINRLLWNDNRYWFSIAATREKEHLLEIAESLSLYHFDESDYTPSTVRSQ